LARFAQCDSQVNSGVSKRRIDLERLAKGFLGIIKIASQSVQATKIVPAVSKAG
jgi:hypothetical protein